MVNKENKFIDELKKRRVYVSEIKIAFKLKQVAGDEKSLNRYAIALDINRPGLELAGYKGTTELKRITIIGIKEQDYLKTLDTKTQKERFDFITDEYTPCIICTAGLKTPKALIEIAKKKNFPVFEVEEQTYAFTSALTLFLSEKLAQSDNIHGEMLSIYGVGVLITGDSGIGKSELALDLVRRGHMLVADDVVDYTKIHNEIICSAPDVIKHMIEVRGLGILDICLMYGAQAYLEKCKLDFVIKLVGKEDYLKRNVNRLQPAENKMAFFNEEKTVLEVSVLEGKSMAPIVEAAVCNYILKRRGVDANESFKETIKENIIKKTKEKK